MREGSENGDVWEKIRLVEMGLSKQLVDKLTEDEAKLALKDIMSMVEERTSTANKRDPFISSIKLYPRKATFLARRTLEQLESGTLGINYSLAAVIPVRLAKKGLDIATTSGAKCKLLLDQPLRAFFGRDERESNLITNPLPPGNDEYEIFNPSLDYQERSTKDDDIPSPESVLGAGGMPDSKAWDEKGDMLFRLGRFSEAVECYSRFLWNYPSKVEVWNKKGSCLFNMAKYFEAERCFDNALVIDNRNAQAWYGKACTAIKTLQSDQALDRLKKAIEYGGEAYRELVSSSHAFSILMDDARFVKLTDHHPTSASLKLD